MVGFSKIVLNFSRFNRLMGDLRRGLNLLNSDTDKFVIILVRKYKLEELRDYKFVPVMSAPLIWPDSDN